MLLLNTYLHKREREMDGERGRCCSKRIGKIEKVWDKCKTFIRKGRKSIVL
jgi:hypothetical protein